MVTKIKKYNMKNRNYIKKNRIIFPIEVFSNVSNENIINFKELKKIKYIDPSKKKHFGVFLTNYKKYKIIDCVNCGFIHAIPFLNKKKIENYYQKKFFRLERKKNYFLKQKKDLAWWEQVYEERINFFENRLKRKGTILDIGCGPGFFLNYAKRRKWKIIGIEPSTQAINYAKKNLGISLIKGDYKLMRDIYDVDVIHTHGVLEHLEDPNNFLSLAKKTLKKKGLIFTSVANDFNQLQSFALTQNKNPWWLLPPEHYNYFNTSSIQRVMKKKFKILKMNVSFPLEIFLLMNENYIKKKNLGIKIHKQRVSLEKNLNSESLRYFKENFYKSFLDLKIGRQIDIICQNKR